MKKLGAIFTACILINMPINQVLSAPKTDKISIQSSDEASPQFQLPEQSRFLSVDFKKTESFTSNHIQNFRSEERRVGKECRFRWWWYH